MKLVFAGTVLAVLGCVSLANGADYKVSVLQPDKVFQGTTLMTDNSNPRQSKVVEVDFEGNVIWSYQPSSSKAALDASIVNGNNVLITVSGRGIYELDRSGKIVWKHEDPEASHDADRLPNGNTLYNLGWQNKGEDVVREVDPNGTLVWSWTGVADYDREPFANLSNEGWMHVNSVSRLANGNTLVSMRNFNTVAEVGPNGRVVRDWTFKGKDKKTGLKTKGRIKGRANHEPEMLANGNMLLALRKPHRYLEFDTKTQEEVWSWSHPGGDKELSTNREANRLPNGNTLGSAGNKLVEVAPDGTIVWQIHAPRGGKNHRKFHKAVRIAPDGTAYGG
ncbi:aryl-sulfate sulfotransferase [Magnetovibrio sp. PR-2]|uniref:aryl-sulfate sulfotransferase n=1 Tax=Magnetovibrio sp. PR-2 TaxID=3120356 RepID=UPI002FCE3D86